MKEGRSLAYLVAEIMSAYVSNNKVKQSDLPRLILDVRQSLADPVPIEAPLSPEDSLTPAVPIAESITIDHVTCLEDGRKFKSMKRHLRMSHGLSPVQYRARWGLPADYPIVASSYAKHRSHLARRSGLGRSKPPL